ncbi:hypothetical protein GQ457_04G017000 [Hibiscus cannabinus]
MESVQLEHENLTEFVLVVLQSLPDSFNQFVLNFNMNEIKKTLPELLGMLRTAESNMKKGGSKSIIMVREAKKGKKVEKSKGGISKDRKCFYCEKFGHRKRNYPLYLEEVKNMRRISKLHRDGLLDPFSNILIYTNPTY